MPSGCPSAAPGRRRAPRPAKGSARAGLPHDRLSQQAVGKAIRQVRSIRHRTDLRREAKAAQEISGSVRLFRGRVQQLEAMAGIAPASVNLILTDIPWGKDFLPQLPELAEFASRCWSPTGYLRRSPVNFTPMTCSG